MFQNSKQSVYKVRERQEILKAAKTEFNLGFDALKSSKFCPNLQILTKLFSKTVNSISFQVQGLQINK